MEAVVPWSYLPGGASRFNLYSIHNVGDGDPGGFQGHKTSPKKRKEKLALCSII